MSESDPGTEETPPSQDSSTTEAEGDGDPHPSDTTSTQEQAAGTSTESNQGDYAEEKIVNSEMKEEEEEVSKKESSMEANNLEPSKPNEVPGPTKQEVEPEKAVVMDMAVEPGTKPAAGNNNNKDEDSKTVAEADEEETVEFSTNHSAAVESEKPTATGEVVESIQADRTTP